MAIIDNDIPRLTAGPRSKQILKNLEDDNKRINFITILKSLEAKDLAGAPQYVRDTVSSAFASAVKAPPPVCPSYAESVALDLCVGDLVIKLNAYDYHNYLGSIQSGENNYVPTGTKGTVIGFETTKRLYTIKESFKEGISPGVYLQNMYPVVQWENGQVVTMKDIGTIGFYELRPHDAYFGRERFDFQRIRGMKPSVEPIETLYYEDDFVRLKKPDEEGKYEVLISEVTFGLIPEETSTLAELAIYKVKSLRTPTYTMYCDNDIESVVSRGNYWAWNHDIAELNFVDYEHAVDFLLEGIPVEYKTVVHYYNDAGKNEVQTVQEVLTLLEEKKIDIFEDNTFGFTLFESSLPENVREHLRALSIAEIKSMLDEMI